MNQQGKSSIQGINDDLTKAVNRLVRIGQKQQKVFNQLNHEKRKRDRDSHLLTEGMDRAYNCASIVENMLGYGDEFHPAFKMAGVESEINAIVDSLNAIYQKVAQCNDDKGFN